MSEAYVLAIDLGTSGPKVVLLSVTGAQLAEEFEPVPLHLLPDDGGEQDPADWWRAVVTATRRLVARGLAPVEQIVGIGITGQWAGMVPVDETGKALGRAILWMDARGVTQIRSLMGGIPSISGYGVVQLLRFLRITGGAPGLAGKDTLAHILWLKAERPELYARAAKLIEPIDWLAAQLCGRIATSYATVGLTWLADTRRIDDVRYHDRLLRRTGVDRSKLADLVPADTVLGPLTAAAAAELGLSPTTQVVVGAPDIQAAAVGSGATRDYEAHYSLGTSAWLVCHLPKRKLDPLHNLATLPSGLPGRYIVVNEQESAAGSLTWLTRNVLWPKDAGREHNTPTDVHAELEQLLLAAPPGSDGVLFTPWLCGERTPVEDHALRGGFANLSLRTEQRHLVRAVYEGVAFNGRWLLETVERLAGQELDPIRIVGGGARSDGWCQVFADVWGRTILRIDHPLGGTARGAGLMAACALGYLDRADIPERVEVTSAFTPDPSLRAVYDHGYAAFRDLYRRNHSFFARYGGH